MNNGHETNPGTGWNPSRGVKKLLGLMERVSVANGVIWTEVTAIRLLVMFSREAKVAPEPAREENIAC